MPNFTGQLRANEIFGALFNMLISQQVFADNIEGLDSSLVDSARVDGTLYGDTKLYYATDVLHSHAWGNDAEATNLLALHRPRDPETQAITLSVFRQIDLTVDNYLSKRAWGNEGAFASFNSVMLGWIGVTKRIYDVLTYNSFIGTDVSSKPTQNIEIQIPDRTDEASSRQRAQIVASEITKLFIHLKDVTRDYNDYEYMRSFKKDVLKVVWNAEFITEIEKLDLPTIFHDNKVFGEDAFSNTLPARFFGTVNGTGGTTASSNTRVRSLIEKQYGDDILFPGDLLPASTPYEANETYTVDDNVICKIMHNRSTPFMSAFEVGTSFFNPKSLTENHYLTWGHNDLEHLKQYPYITIKAKSLAKSAKA